MSTEKKKHSAWEQALHLAAQTPESRNRYVDFLRAFSIIIVICGHWLVVAFYVKDGEIFLPDILSISPWTQWLTWILQVMPIFFIVGGFSNSISWQSALKRGEGYKVWFATRLRRLISPVLPVLVIWAVIGIIANLFNADTAILKPASAFALLPAWFLVVYIVVVSLVPLVYRAWERFKIGSFWMLVAAAILVDAAVFLLGWKSLGWVNYIFVWVAVHQLGVAWQAQSMGDSRKRLLWAFGGIAALIALVTFGPYPISMVSVHGEEISNTLPPNLTMLALGVFQSGLLLSLEKPIRKWLSTLKIWAATVLINGMIMTLFLWHVTVLVLVAGLLLALGGIGLGVAPGSGAWWLTRQIWILLLSVILLTLVPIFLRYERLPSQKSPSSTPTWRLLLGALFFCTGLAILTLKGVTTNNLLGVRVIELALPFIGAVIAKLGVLSSVKMNR